jgi:hypothetical protein
VSAWFGEGGVSVHLGGEWCTCVFFFLEVHRSTPHHFPWNPTDPNTNRICLRTLFKLACGCVLLSSKPQFEFHVYIV